jgi:hypothetical protein
MQTQCPLLKLDEYLLVTILQQTSIQDVLNIRQVRISLLSNQANSHLS